MGLGGYGTGDHLLTGEQARREVREVRDGTAKDGSIMATKRARKAAELEATNTFEYLAREWYAVKCKTWTEGTAFRTIGA